MRISFPALCAVANEVADFDDVITRATQCQRRQCARIKYRQVAQGIVERNPSSHVACSAIFLAGHCKKRYYPAKRSVHAACRERSSTFVGGLVNGRAQEPPVHGQHGTQLSLKPAAHWLASCARRLKLQMCKFGRSQADKIAVCAKLDTCVK